MQISSSLQNPLLSLLGGVQGTSSVEGASDQAAMANGDTSSSATSAAAPMSSGGATTLSSPLLTILQGVDHGDVPAGSAADPSSSQQFMDNIGYYYTPIPQDEWPEHATPVPGMSNLTPSQVTSIENKLGVKAVYSLNSAGQVDPTGYSLWDPITGTKLDDSDPRYHQFLVMADQIGTSSKSNSLFGSGSAEFNTVLAKAMTTSLDPVFDSTQQNLAKQWLAGQAQSASTGANSTSA